MKCGWIKFKVSMIYYHPNVGYGTFIKQFYRTGFGETIVIKLSNNREYFAPAYEFIKIE